MYMYMYTYMYMYMYMYMLYCTHRRERRRRPTLRMIYCMILPQGKLRATLSSLAERRRHLFELRTSATPQIFSPDMSDARAPAKQPWASR